MGAIVAKFKRITKIFGGGLTNFIPGSGQDPTLDKRLKNGRDWKKYLRETVGKLRFL